MRPGSSLLRVVIDTNVLFSAVALPRESPPAQIVELARQGKFEVFLSPFIIAELERNLALKAGWEEERISALRKKLRGFAAFIEPASHVDAVQAAEDDNRILECAVDSGADVLVTGDLRHLRPMSRFRGVEILTPREFLTKHFPPH